MGDIPEYFDRAEFACKCGCGFDTVDAELLGILGKVREYFGRKMKITSGCRCPTHNQSIEGAPKSFHMAARAADVQVDSVSPQLVAEAAAQFGARGIKAYDTFTHIDTRSGAEWRG
jgi:uncharacterized protein YcbK (DUF882 family)